MTEANGTVNSAEQFRELFVPRNTSDFEGVSGLIGAELEGWLVRQGAVQNVDGPFCINGTTLPGATRLAPEMFVPRAGEIIAQAREQGGPAFTTEFSGCQVELNTGAHARADRLVEDLLGILLQAREYVQHFGCDLIAHGLAPEGVPEVPNPIDPRYVAFAQSMPRHITSAMFRVAALHLHVGVQHEAELFEKYNALVAALSVFRRMGDFTGGERMRLFETTLYPSCLPPQLCDWDDAFRYYRLLGLARIGGPKMHWGWVRLSAARYDADGRPLKPMTVELRIMDATSDMQTVFRIVQRLRNLCA